MTSTQLYTVPVIAGDLRRVELIKQCADTFDYLDFVSQDMFNRIAIRLNAYRAQLNKFDEHIQHVNEHIDRIKDSECAIRVHSSARYPVEQNRSTFKSIFDSDTNKPLVFSYDLFHSNGAINKFIDSNDKDSKSNDDTLIVSKQYEENFIQKTKRTNLNGLGKLPTNIKSVVSFLKHNTQENPYIQATNIDPLNTGPRIRKQVDETIQSRFAEIPFPAFYTQMSERPVMSDINYNPRQRLGPELSLPDNLPELNNYAIFVDNTVIDWTKQQTASIAPSFAISMLPDINDLSSTTITTPPVESPKPTVCVAAPVDIPAIVSLTSASTSIPVPPSPPVLVLAPPFLPTLPSVSTPPTVVDKSQATPINTINDGVVDSHNALFSDIIASAHKKTLKPVRKPNAADQVPLPNSSIADAIKDMLGPRRRLIAGESSQQKDDSDDDDDSSEWSQ